MMAGEDRMETIGTGKAGLQAQLTGVLIGIARATDGNEHLISDSTDKIVRDGLAATIPDSDLKEESLAALIQDAEDEKRRLIPL